MLDGPKLESYPGRALDALKGIRDTILPSFKGLEWFGIPYNSIELPEIQHMCKQAGLIVEHPGIGQFQVTLDTKVRAIVHSPRMNRIWATIMSLPRTQTFEEALRGWLGEEIRAMNSEVIDESIYEGLIAGTTLTVLVATEIHDLRESDPESQEISNLPEVWRRITGILLQTRPPEVKSIPIRDIGPKSDPSLCRWLSLVSPFFELWAEEMSPSVRRFRTQSAEEPAM